MTWSEYHVYLHYQKDNEVISMALRCDATSSEKVYYFLKGRGYGIPKENEIGPFDKQTALEHLHAEIGHLEAAGFHKIIAK
ncbi:MAG: hypothetical protein HZB67_01360 [Candidatus Aenigmarchaeota archaeon]|nr:hypothetical protein [Candidatus Aenigmarchaeota archaeon]